MVVLCVCVGGGGGGGFCVGRGVTAFQDTCKTW